MLVEFNLYEDIKTFYRDTFEILMRHEAQNLIPLGNVLIGIEGKDKNEWRDPSNWFMATVTDKGAPLLTAIMTPPHNLTLYATDNVIDDEAISCLIQGIGETSFSVPGVMTVELLAQRFALSFATAKGLTYTVKFNQRIYELEEVNPHIPLTGALRPARESDMSFLPYWFEGFDSDCFGHAWKIDPDPQHYLYHIDEKNLYILEDNHTPVTMAKKSREMQNVCGVSYVYTPPYFRRRGYATSCVAGLSSLILEQGFRKCVLYTDLANPVSNSIYQKIGYRPVCDSLEIKFEAEEKL